MEIWNFQPGYYNIVIWLHKFITLLIPTQTDANNILFIISMTPIRRVLLNAICHLPCTHPKEPDLAPTKNRISRLHNLESNPVNSHLERDILFNNNFSPQNFLILSSCEPQILFLFIFFIQESTCIRSRIPSTPTSW